MGMTRDYVQGLEDMHTIIKSIFELPVDERKSKYGSSDVATILDRFDFAQLLELFKGCNT